MPPKPKFTREEIVEAALKLVSEKGAEALTARELGTALGSSARPIFTAFKNMEEVQGEVQLAAMHRFNEYAARKIEGIPLFKQIGMQMIMFGIEEPKLYRMLFMQEHPETIGFDGIFSMLGDMAQVSLNAIKEDYGLDDESAKALFENMWIYTFGIGTLCATRVCSFSKREIGELLTAQFNAVLNYIGEKK